MKDLVLSAGKPLLEDPVVTQSRFDQLIELFGIEEARARSLHGRRRVHRNDVKGFTRPLQESPPVVDDDSSSGVSQNALSVVKEITEGLLDAGHELHGLDMNPPGQSGPERRPHPKADHKRRIRS